MVYYSSTNKIFPAAEEEIVALRLVLVGAFLCSPMMAQRVDPVNMYHRVFCVVPLTGSGTTGDPVRPKYAPAQITPGSRKGIVAYTHVLSDDGKLALVEFVAYDPTVFQALLTDNTITVFIKGEHKRQEIEAAFQAYKKDFDYDSFVVRVP
jgi:hypothetical protein